MSALPQLARRERRLPSDLRELVAGVLAGERLVGPAADRALELLCDAEADLGLQVALLAGLRARGEEPGELADLALALRRRALPVECGLGGAPLLDTCGTGGDGSNSVNLSTLTALVAAAAGLRVAKHGNRSVSSRCGSADLIEALGVPLAADPGAVRAGLERHRFAFLFAPAFHPTVGAVGAARRHLGTRTVFNLLGPLANPAAPTHQLLGACDPDTARTLAAALARTNVGRAFVVHGTPGWDEATPCGPFLRLDVRDGRVDERVIDPIDYGLDRCRPEELAGGDAARNRELAEALLGGERGPIRDAVLLNAALALELVEGLEPRAGIIRAAGAIDGGAARALVEALR